MRTKELFNIAERKKFEEIDFLLKTDMLKPVFPSLKNRTNGNFTCMLDSGASMPVWCSGARLLKFTFPEAIIKEEKKSILSGFGKGFECVDVYYVPKIELCNGQHSVVFEQAYLPVVERDNFGANLILPSSVLKDANIIISQIQSLSRKRLILQGSYLYYKMKYTICSLSSKQIRILKKIHKITESIDALEIVGAEEEFEQELIQLNSLLLLNEDTEA